MNSEEKLDTLINTVTRIEQALRGYNGDPGLIKEHCDLKKDYYKFKMRALAVFYFLLGSGVLGISIWQIIGLAS